MSHFFKSTGFRIFCIIIAALIAGSVFAVASRTGTSPLNKITDTIFSPASRLASSIVSELKGLPISFRSSSKYKAEIEELNDEIDKLREQLVDYEDVANQNEFYKEFLELRDEHSDYKFAEAAIIGRDSTGTFSSFTLNKGKASGIKVNDPVIYGKYLVGVVTSVGETTCTVHTLLNPKFNVSAYEIRTREVSYVTTTVAYSKDGLCMMPGLPTSTAINIGSLVCTAGVGGKYPADLIIGTVTDIVDSAVDTSTTAVITPGVDFSQLTDLFIITSFDGQASN